LLQKRGEPHKLISSKRNNETALKSANVPITSTDALDTLKITQKIFEACGPRESGSSNVKKAAFMIRKELNKYCDSAHIEEFKVYPGAFIGFMKVLAVGYVIGTALVLLGGWWILLATFVYTATTIWTNSQFTFFGQLFDPFYKRAKGYNVVGTIEPTNRVKAQIIICGHHDSAHVFTFLQDKKFQRYYSHRISLGLFPPIVGLIGSWIWSIYWLVTGNTPGIALGLQIFVVIGLILVIPLFFFTSDEVNPGIGDNLNSSSMAIKLAEIFGTAKKQGKSYLEHTRLILVSTDSEEEGLRGSRAYVKRHKKELKKIPTFVIVPECIYKLEDLQLAISDLNGFMLLSKSLSIELQNIAKAQGYNVPLFQFPFGAGATDAAEFARIRVESASIVGMGTTLIRENEVYHTSEDNLDKIEPAAVEASLKIMMGYILKKDSQF
jgi:aminopeptidase YwaD